MLLLLVQVSSSFSLLNAIRLGEPFTTLLRYQFVKVITRPVVDPLKPLDAPVLLEQLSPL